MLEASRTTWGGLWGKTLATCFCFHNAWINFMCKLWSLADWVFLNLSRAKPSNRGADQNRSDVPWFIQILTLRTIHNSRSGNNVTGELYLYFIFSSVLGSQYIPYCFLLWCETAWALTTSVSYLCEFIGLLVLLYMIKIYYSIGNKYATHWRQFISIFKYFL